MRFRHQRNRSLESNQNAGGKCIIYEADDVLERERAHLADQTEPERSCFAFDSFRGRQLFPRERIDGGCTADKTDDRSPHVAS